MQKKIRRSMKKENKRMKLINYARRLIGMKRIGFHRASIGKDLGRKRMWLD